LIRYLGARRDEAGNITEDLIADELAARVAGKLPVMPGAAIITGPGELGHTHNVKYIIHVAAVRRDPASGFRQVEGLDLCVSKCLSIVDARENKDGVRSIVFPLLGVGSGRGGHGPTAVALVSTAVDYLINNPETRINMVYLLASSDRGLAALANAVKECAVLSAED
jgi:O-acetyl-ADP-ribose deacetylase (regulator of RNase III)